MYFSNICTPDLRHQALKRLLSRAKTSSMYLEDETSVLAPFFEILTLRNEELYNFFINTLIKSPIGACGMLKNFKICCDTINLWI